VGAGAGGGAGGAISTAGAGGGGFGPAQAARATMGTKATAIAALRQSLKLATVVLETADIP